MNKEAFIEIWGSAANLARAIGEGETTVRNWFNRFSIPAQYDAKIIAASKMIGRDVTPQDLFELRQSLMAARQENEQQKELREKGAA